MDEIRVSLNRDQQTGIWDLSASIGDRDVTEYVLDTKMIVLRPYLPSERRNFMRIARQRYETVNYFLQRRFMQLQETITGQVLTDAIRAYLTEAAPELIGEQGHESVLTGDNVVAEQLAAAAPAFLSIGGRMFRLTPEAHTGAPVKVLDRMRKQASLAIARERQAMIAAAEREAQVIRTQAERERTAQQAEIARLRAERVSNMVIPQWLEGYYVMRHNGWLMIEQPITYQPTSFNYPQRTIGRRVYTVEWTAEQASPVTVKFWLAFSPADGLFSIERSYIAGGQPVLPHANSVQFCCQPQGLPQRIAGQRDLATVISAINRAFRVVNLSSLLTVMVDWNAAVQAFVPDGLKEYLSDLDEGNDIPTTVDGFTERYGATVSPIEAPNLTWQART